MSDLLSPESRRLRVIHLEDDVGDQVLVAEMLEAEGIPCDIVYADNRDDFQSALLGGDADIIISDHALPGYDGVRALKAAKSLRSNVPFIFFSGTLGEEAAVDSLRNGATDYVLKQRPGRLIAAVKRALAENDERRARERAEQELRRREVLLEQVIANVDDVITVMDLEGRTMVTSASHERMFGSERPQEDFFARIHPADRARVQSAFDAIVGTKSGQRLSYRLATPDGSPRFVEAQGTVILNEDGEPKMVLWVSRDITERMRAQERMAEQAALLDKASDAILVCDMDQQIVYWNEGATRVYGWAPGEILNERLEEMLFRHRPSDWGRIHEAVLERGEWVGELRQVTKDGRQILVESRQTLVRTPSGEPKSILHINSDLTEKKKIEAQILRTQRMDNLGALAGGIAHDLNNVLGPIMMAAELVRASVRDEQNIRFLQLIATSARRGSDLVKQILSFARGVEGEKILLPIEGIVSEIALLTKDTFPRSITVRTDVASGLPNVRGDATLLHQILLNLCVNARDAMPDGGELRIRVSLAVLKDRTTAIGNEKVSGSFIELEVADTGTGIPPEVLPKIFDPFFTTKAVGKGTGLGLATVLGIVRNHGGFLDVASKLGEGTTFRIYLPVQDAQDKEEDAPDEPRPQQGSGEQILVVDDEVAMLAMLRTTLNVFNYRVLSATNGAEGLELFVNHSREIAAVITDMMMPTVGGQALIQAMQAIDPEVKVIGMSGLTEPADLPAGLEKNVRAFLRKPFPATMLLSTLRSILDA